MGGGDAEYSTVEKLGDKSGDTLERIVVVFLTWFLGVVVNCVVSSAGGAAGATEDITTCFAPANSSSDSTPAACKEASSRSWSKSTVGLPAVGDDSVF